jgi:hypothetical protein
MPATTQHHIPSALVLSAVLVVGAVVARSPGEASADAASTAATAATRRLQAPYEQQPAVVGAPVCSPNAACVIPFSLLGVSAGDVDGTFAQAGAASLLADGTIYANSTLVFTGVVAGCGTGTVTMRSTGINSGGTTSGSIEIIEGSGTADLATLSGTGTVLSGAIDPATGIGSGVIEYKIKC